MTLLQELRASTHDVHEQLEAMLDVPSRCADPASYAALLIGMRSAYAPLEHAVSTSPATHATVPDWASRLKTSWLDDDLAALGREVQGAAGAVTLPRAEDVVGTVYVMEGATLGAAVICRELATLDWAPPTRFFTGYGRGRGAMWQAFRRTVDDVERRGCDADAVVAAARRTFAAVEASCGTALAR